LELYRRGRWHYSVLEEPTARACGPLPDVPAEADFAEAQAALLSLVERAYGTACQARWQQTEADWWVGEVDQP
jgi:hypothetical protein